MEADNAECRDNMEEEELEVVIFTAYWKYHFGLHKLLNAQDDKDTIQIRMQNVVATVNLGTRLNLVTEYVSINKHSNTEVFSVSGPNNTNCKKCWIQSEKVSSSNYAY